MIFSINARFFCFLMNVSQYFAVVLSENGFTNTNLQGHPLTVQPFGKLLWYFKRSSGS